MRILIILFTLTLGLDPAGWSTPQLQVGDRVKLATRPGGVVGRSPRCGLEPGSLGHVTAVTPIQGGNPDCGQGEVITVAFQYQSGGECSEEFNVVQKVCLNDIGTNDLPANFLAIRGGIGLVAP